MYRDWGLTFLRIVVGIVFIAHGWRKLFGAGIGRLTEIFAGMGLPLPAVSAVLATSAELLGGLAFVLGLWTRWAAAPLAFVMLVAMFVVHLRHGFFLPEGYEFTLTLLAAVVAIGLAGPGALSLDAAHLRRKGRS